MEDIHKKPYGRPVRNPDQPWGQGEATGSITSLNRRPAMPFNRIVPINTPLPQRVALETALYNTQLQQINDYRIQVNLELNAQINTIPAAEVPGYNAHRQIHTLICNNIRHRLQNSYQAFRVNNPINGLGDRIIERPVIGVDPGCKMQVVAVKANLGELAIELHAALEEADAALVGNDAQREVALAPLRMEAKNSYQQNIKKISGKEYR